MLQSASETGGGQEQDQRTSKSPHRKVSNSRETHRHLKISD
jgi:hypothetical protein